MNKQIKKIIRETELRQKASELWLENGKNYSKKELIILAKAAGIKYFSKFKKYELASKLGINLPEPIEKQRGNRIFRSARVVEVNNPDGTITTYPSITRAAKALGRPPIQIYVMAVNGKLKINYYYYYYYYAKNFTFNSTN